MVTRIEWIVDQLKDYGVLQNAFYCEFPALGRGATDETEWFLWNIIKADLYRQVQQGFIVIRTFVPTHTGDVPHI